jgi:hypothetical protein
MIIVPQWSIHKFERMSVEERLANTAYESTVIISYVFVHCSGGTAPVKLISKLFWHTVFQEYFKY